MRHAIHSVYKKTVETILPPLSKSEFELKRVLTPAEFVTSGDYLVHACPTWTWEGGDPAKRKGYLPADKQYLVTRNVPCLKRASDLETLNAGEDKPLEGEDDGWIATAETAAGESEPTEIPELPAENEDDDDNIPDIADLDLQEDDEAALPAPKRYLVAEEPEDNIVRTRTYDLYITYDQYYQVPRFWLVGFDETRHPLSAEQILDDVSEEHAKKTITVDPHPHLAVHAASIHPCRHAEVMSKLAGNFVKSGREFSVDHYLVLFLKFIASVVPTIQYDYTMSVGGSTR